MITDYTAAIMPLIISMTVGYSMLKGYPVFDDFMRGAAEGLRTCVHILPTLVGLLTAVYMLRASGMIDMLSYAMAPLLSLLGIPAECAPLMLLKPFSGSGGLAIGSEIINHSGVDSYAGRVAAVMLGSAETTFYTIAVYFGAVGIKNSRYTIPAALCADLTAFVMAAVTVRLFMGG